MKSKDGIKDTPTSDVGVQDKQKENEKQIGQDFDRVFNKELRVSQDEVPIVLNELNDT